VTPGIGSHSPRFQSRTTPPGWANSSAESWSSGAAITSVRVPRCVEASRENCSPMVLNTSKSVRVSHGGAMAGLNECTNGCMSVVEMSCFSYQGGGRKTVAG